MMKNTHNYRQIASEYFNKELLPGECVHHIDGDHYNNNPENLVIMKTSQHRKVHGIFNFENWRKINKKPICNFCMFYNVYQISEKTYTLPILYKLLEISSTRLFKNEETVDIVYNIIKTWKEETKHDCYTGENMEAIYDKY